MTHPAVQTILDAIADNWSAGSFADIPLERIDRDNSELLDGGVRSHTEDLQDSNYVGATLADRSADPIGTEYDHRLEVVVGVRIEGAHHSEWGYVNPDASLPPATAGDPVPWQPLVDEIRTAILRDRREPTTGETDIDYLDLQITNEAPQSADYGDYYRHDVDVLLTGYETLP